MTKTRQRQRQKARKALANIQATKERRVRLAERVDFEGWDKIEAKKTLAENAMLAEMFGVKREYDDWECREVIARLKAEGVYRKIEEEESKLDTEGSCQEL